METGVFRGFFNDSRGFVHCWTIASGESEIFWLAYANPFGVAIASTIARLQSALSVDHRLKLEFDKVDYRDAKKITGVEPWKVKRRWFQFEREYRVHVPWHVAAPDDSLLVKADLKNLISAVWISPYAPKYLDKLIDRELQNHGLKLKAQRRPEPQHGPRPVTIKLDDYILGECRKEARKRHKALSDYIAGELEDKFNPP